MIHKNFVSFNLRSINGLFALILLLLTLVPLASTAQTSTATSHATTTGPFLSLKDGKVLNRKEFDALKPKITKHFEYVKDDLFLKKRPWVYYKGNLKVNGNFLNSYQNIIVEGDLIVEGLYYDKPSVLIVLGNMYAHNVVTEFPLYVTGNLNATGIVYPHFNDFGFEVGKQLSTKVLIISDRSAYYKSLKAEIKLFSEDYSEEANLEAARRLLPELYVRSFSEESILPEETGQAISEYEFYGVPHADSVIAYTKKNSNVFREKPASASATIFKKELAIASHLSTKNQLAKITANPNLDIYIAMNYASRNDLPDQAVMNLIQKKNEAVLQVLAHNHSLKLKFFDEISALSISATEDLVDHLNVKNSFLEGLLHHSNPLYRIALTKKSELDSKYLEALALDTSLEVRKSVLAIHQFETSQKVIDSNIGTKDDALLVDLIAYNKNFSFLHYEQLASNSSAKVRKALAENLTEPSLFLRYKKSTDAERLSILRKLSSDPDVKVKARALSGLTAKEQERALGSTNASNQTVLLELLAPNLKSKKLAQQIIESNNDELISYLAENNWLSEDVQNQIVQIYLKKFSNLKEKLSESQAQPINLVLTALLADNKTYPSVLEKLSNYCFGHLYPPSFCYQLQNEKLTSLIIKKYASIQNKALKELMYEGIRNQAYASQAEILKTDLVDTAAYNKFVKKLSKKTESDFWIFLSEQKDGQNKETAAINVNTPLETLKKLEQSTHLFVSEELLDNPVVPAELKKKIMTKTKEFVYIKEVESDFYLNVLNGTIKTKRPLEETDKEDLSGILMRIYMLKQFE